MSGLQNPTNGVATVGDVLPVDVQYTRLDYRQQCYVDYCAASGLVVDEDGTASSMKAADFAQRVGVARQTLYDWQKTIPNFWALADMRARVLYNGKRKFMIWKGLFARAAKGEAKQAEMVLSHFGDYKPPALKIDAEMHITGLADLIEGTRQVINLEQQPDGSYSADSDQTPA